MTNEIAHLIRISTLRDIQIKLKESQIENMIIPEVVFEIIKNLEDNYDQELAELKPNQNVQN
jgi:hypothetical protein